LKKTLYLTVLTNLMNKNKLISLIVLLFFCFSAIYAQDNGKEKVAIKKLLDLAAVDFGNSKYDSALEHSKKALVRSFTIDDHLLIAQSYNTIGAIFNECSESGKAIEFYNKALAYNDKVGNDKMYNWIYSNLGSVYYFNEIDIPKGIDYYKKALPYAIKNKDTAQIHYTKLNLASAYFALDQYDLGNQQINDIKDQIFAKGDDESKMSLYHLLGIYASNNNQKNLGETYFKAAAKIAETNGFDNFLVNIYKNFVQHYTLYKELDKANFYQQKLDLINEVLYSRDKVDNIKKAANQIELQEYKIQLEKIENQNQQQEESLKESKLVVILFIVILIILLLLLLTLYKNVKLREQANQELTEANEALKEAKEKAEEASRLKSQFVSTITHELRTPLYGVIGITNIITDEHRELANSPHLKSLKFSAKYLLSLVNDILQIN